MFGGCNSELNTLNIFVMVMHEINIIWVSMMLLYMACMVKWFSIFIFTHLGLARNYTIGISYQSTSRPYRSTPDDKCLGGREEVLGIKMVKATRL